MTEGAEVTVRCAEHNRLLEIFGRAPEEEGWEGLILTNVGDARSGHDAIVAAEIDAGVSGEVVERRHLVWRDAKWINRHRGGIDRTEQGFKMECPRCKRPPFHFREPMFGQLLDGLALQGINEIDLHALVSLYRRASHIL